MRFSLVMMIGEAGDDFNNSTVQCPMRRQRVIMGTLTLDDVPPDQQAQGERPSYTPCLLTTGIDVSDDPVLHIRKEAYALSSKWRGGAPCLFPKGTDHGT